MSELFDINQSRGFTFAHHFECAMTGLSVRDGDGKEIVQTFKDLTIVYLDGHNCDSKENALKQDEISAKIKDRISDIISKADMDDPLEKST